MSKKIIYSVQCRNIIIIVSLMCKSDFNELNTRSCFRIKKFLGLYYNARCSSSVNPFTAKLFFCNSHLAPNFFTFCYPAGRHQIIFSISHSQHQVIFDCLLFRRPLTVLSYFAKKYWSYVKVLYIFFQRIKFSTRKGFFSHEK